MVVRPFAYHSDIHTVSGRNGNIRVENLTPQLSEEALLQQRRCIEEGLFEVFRKYTNSSAV